MEDFETKPTPFLVMTQSLLHPLRGTGSMSCLLQAAPPCRSPCWALWDRLLRAGGSRGEVRGASHAQRGDAVPMISSPPWEPPFRNLEERIHVQVKAGLWALLLHWDPQPFPTFLWTILICATGLPWLPAPSQWSHEWKAACFIPSSSLFFSSDCWQSFWHDHLISLWQEDGSMGELWINS